MQLEDYRCIAIVGAGGKTSLIYALAGHFVDMGRKVLITTSTHIRRPAGHPFAVWGDEDAVRENLQKEGYCVTGIAEQGTGKLTCPSAPDWKALLALCDVLLVEADGAHGRPLKVPAAHEPVIPPIARLIIGVAGLDALDGKISDVCHRPGQAAEFLGCGPDHRITEEDIAAICCSGQGLQKGVEGRDFAVVLNKADNVQKAARGDRIRRKIQEKMGEKDCPKVEVVSLGKSEIAVILLAAGNSRRFGRENKLLYQINGRTLFEHTLELALSLQCGSVTVVTQYDEIAQIAGARGAKVLFNPHPEEGISSSIKIGIRANPRAGAWMLCVCDLPYMRRETLEDLIGCYLTGGKKIAALSLSGKIVNPAIFSSRYGPELLKLHGDVGGKHVVTAHREDTTLCPVSDKEELRDIDRPVLRRNMQGNDR